MGGGRVLTPGPQSHISIQNLPYKKKSCVARMSHPQPNLRAQLLASTGLSLMPYQ